MTTRLPQTHQHRQHRNPIPAPRCLTRKFAYLLPPLFQNLPIHPLLLIRKLTKGNLLNLSRKILSHLSLGSSQKKRAHPMPQSRLGSLIPHFRHRNFIPVPKISRRPQISRHQEIVDRPKIEQGVFQRGSRQHHAMITNQLLHADRCLACPIFNILGLIQNHRIKLHLLVDRNIPSQKRIARYHQVILWNLGQERLSPRPIQGQHFQSRGKLPSLIHPVNHQAGGTEH